MSTFPTSLVMCSFAHSTFLRPTEWAALDRSRVPNKRGICNASLHSCYKVWRRIVRLAPALNKEHTLTWKHMRRYFPDVSRSVYYESVRALARAGLLGCDGEKFYPIADAAPTRPVFASHLWGTPWHNYHETEVN